MAKVKIQGNASGTGVVTLTAPNTNTDRIITLPDGTGELLAKDSSGNVGIGVVPNSWTTDYGGSGHIQFGYMGSLYQTGSSTYETVNLASNMYRNTSNVDVYTNGSRPATQYQTYQGTHSFNVAGIGTADSAISWTAAMTIDNSGAVLMPKQPCFGAFDSNGATINGNTEFDVPLDSEDFDTTNSFNTSTSRFTAPVAGRYLFTASIQYGNTGGCHSNFYVNNTSVNNGWNDFGDTTMATHSRVLQLNVNDYVTLRGYWGGSGTTTWNGPRTKMTGYLIG